VLAHVSAVQAQPPEAKGDQQAGTQCQTPCKGNVVVQCEDVVKETMSRGLCQEPSYMPVPDYMVPG
jgi:hypothetical protein